MGAMICRYIPPGTPWKSPANQTALPRTTVSLAVHAIRSAVFPFSTMSLYYMDVSSMIVRSGKAFLAYFIAARQQA
jgi:hypothetical protein